ncbi:HepT-like ribonuclease domain-containing protein [Hymenobacter latericus]|uniref:HepT-like ribonuclease domain-containing protein n=1 Tax=Hymenobacter sp. YIM 151858-1 TaxID=2987688 RepID=UPI002227C301|nr:HepT-like ribonuclease domain-containing protein [Hymenobacter sp. YIM 151858-1]UYZ57682.1 DUF86 domain-containing protein [Hymenobacter sp. YIM 151858-1]
MSKLPNDRLRLEHMLAAAEQALGAYEALPGHRLPDGDYRFFAFVKLVEIIGEAASKLTPELRQRHPGIEWKRIIGMRHILVHDYDNIDEALLWRVVQQELPTLRRHLQEILATSAA